MGGEGIISSRCLKTRGCLGILEPIISISCLLMTFSISPRSRAVSVLGSTSKQKFKGNLIFLSIPYVQHFRVKVIIYYEREFVNNHSFLYSRCVYNCTLALVLKGKRKIGTQDIFIFSNKNNSSNNTSSLIIKTDYQLMLSISIFLPITTE